MAKTSDKKILGRIRNQLLYFSIELYKLNYKLHSALITEIKADAKLLKNRVQKQLSLQHVYEDFFYKLKNLGRHLANECRYHLKNYHSATGDKRAHLALASKVTNELALIYKLLRNDDHVLRFRKIILIKIMKMFKEILNLSNKNAKLLAKNINLLAKERFFSSNRDLYKIALIVDKQIKTLHNFSINFNNYIIHSEPFYTGREKHIIITHDVKPVF